MSISSGPGVDLYAHDSRLAREVEDKGLWDSVGGESDDGQVTWFVRGVPLLDPALFERQVLGSGGALFAVSAQTLSTKAESVGDRRGIDGGSMAPRTTSTGVASAPRHRRAHSLSNHTCVLRLRISNDSKFLFHTLQSRSDRCLTLRAYVSI